MPEWRNPPYETAPHVCIPGQPAPGVLKLGETRLDLVDIEQGIWRLSPWLSPPRSAFLGTLVFVLLLLELLSALPGVGGLLVILVAANALGAVALTQFGMQRFVPVEDEEVAG